MSYTVASLYHFADFVDYEEFQEPLRRLCVAKGLCGIILLASEGINGTIAGSDVDVHEVLSFIRGHSLFGELDYKLSYSDKRPYLRMKVRLKSEIICMRSEDVGVNPLERTGVHVSASDWNDLISCDDVVVLDTRNDYESAIGKFEGAIEMDSRFFSEFPSFIEAHRDKFEGKRVAMYCTGGIRCEKASSYMLARGFGEVYQLRGGILRYLEQVSEEDSLWRGDCFVFDRRVAVGHGLRQGGYDICPACGRAVSDIAKGSSHFELGVSCDYCYDRTTEFQKGRFRERQHQIELARSRGFEHLGSDG